MRKEGSSMKEIMDKYFGQTISLELNENFMIDCRVVDIRKNYGAIHFKVMPVKGSGSMWVLETRCTLIS